MRPHCRRTAPRPLRPPPTSGRDDGGRPRREGGVAASIEMVSVVFTDLVDSTAIASRVGPDAAETLRQTHFSLLRSAISAAGGIEVKNLGDGLMVVFTSPSRAVACAVGMQQALERHNRRAEPSLFVRIGIS